MTVFRGDKLMSQDDWRWCDECRCITNHTSTQHRAFRHRPECDERCVCDDEPDDGRRFFIGIRNAVGLTALVLWALVVGGLAWRLFR